MKITELDCCEMMINFLAMKSKRELPDVTVEVHTQKPKFVNNYTEVPYVLIKDKTGRTLLDMVLLYDGHVYDTAIHWCVEAYFHLADIDIVYWTIDDSDWNKNFDELREYLRTGLEQYLVDNHFEL